MGGKVPGVFEKKNIKNNNATLTSYKNLKTENDSKKLVRKESFSVDEIYKTKRTTSIQEDFVVFNSAVEG